MLLALPFGMFGALRRPICVCAALTNDVYFQIGLVTLLGLAAKNAILIVEFAALSTQKGMSASAAAIEAARLRFRPILMTSLAFILGVLPLAISTGAGAGARHSIGTGVMGGMLAATFLAIFFVPLFFRLIIERQAHRARAAATSCSRRSSTRTWPHARAAHARPSAASAAWRRSCVTTLLRRSLLALAALARAARARPPPPPQLDLPAGHRGGQPSQLDRWWTAFDDPALDRARRRGARATTSISRPRWRASRRRARRSMLAQSTCTRRVDLDAGGVAASARRRSARTRCRSGLLAVATDLTVALQASYEVDLWGKYRNGDPRRAATICSRPSTRAKPSARWSPPTPRARYFNLLAADAQLRARGHAARRATRPSRCRRDRFKAGIIGEYDLRTAEAERAAVAGDIAAARRAVVESRVGARGAARAARRARCSRR